MNIKDQLIQEINQMPESMIGDVLEFVLSLKAERQVNLEQSDVWDAYLASKREREEVYRRLANS